MRVTYAYRCPALGKQFKQANERGAARVLIVDAETQSHQRVGVKDMATGIQVSLPLESVLAAPFQPLNQLS
jgi:histidyl-tRNA synthetase